MWGGGGGGGGGGEEGVAKREGYCEAGIVYFFNTESNRLMVCMCNPWVTELTLSERTAALSNIALYTVPFHSGCRCLFFKRCSLVVYLNFISLVKIPLLHVTLIWAES